MKSTSSTSTVFRRWDWLILEHPRGKPRHISDVVGWIGNTRVEQFFVGLSPVKSMTIRDATLRGWNWQDCTLCCNAISDATCANIAKLEANKGWAFGWFDEHCIFWCKKYEKKQKKTGQKNTGETTLKQRKNLKKMKNYVSDVGISWLKFVVGQGHTTMCGVEHKSVSSEWWRGVGPDRGTWEILSSESWVPPSSSQTTCVVDHTFA